MGVAAGIEPVLRGVAAKCLRVAPETIDPHAPLARYGLDSLSALELCVALTEATGIDVGEDDLLDAPSIHALAHRLMAAGMKPPSIDRRVERMLADARLPTDIDPRSQRSGAGSAVMLTGATGFLGAHVLAALAATGKSTLVCPVRARDDRHALDRIHATMDRYGVRIRDARVRVVAIAADLHDPCLGRPLDEYRRLAHAVAEVIHCAADVNWALAYEGLRAANVLVTQNLLRFASSGARKRFHFVSSLAARYSTRAASPAAEDGIAPDPAGIHLGYAQSKWVAERLVEACCDRGLDAIVYRPSLISGDSRSGIGNDDDLFAQLVRGAIALGHAPDLDWRLDACPVDYVAQAIARVVCAPLQGLRALHLRNPQPARWSEAVLWMNVRGYQVRLEPFAAWIERAERASRDPHHALHRLRSFLLARPEGEAGRTLPEIYADPAVARVDAERSDALVERLGIRCPRMSARLLQRCFDAWVAHGTLPPRLGREKGQPATIDDARIERELQAHFSDPAMRIAATRAHDFGFEHSILGELASGQAGHAVAMQARSIELRCANDRCVTLEIVVKPKHPDSVVLEIAAQVAALCSDALGAAFCAHRAATGLVGNAQRELGIYRGATGALRETLPACYGVVAAGGSSALLLERLGAPAAPHRGDQDPWTHARIETALHGIGRIHGEWLGREAEVEALLGGSFGVGAAVGGAPLWRALSDYARSRLGEWIGAAGARLQSGLADAAPAWLAAHAALPRTLTHNDFNPRNVIVTADGRLRAFDWELAEFGLPQRDAIEMLCFVLPPDASTQGVHRFIEYHREVTQSAAGIALDPALWCRGVRLALADFGVRRLPMYVMADRFRTQTFLERVTQTWLRLCQIYGMDSPD